MVTAAKTKTRPVYMFPRQLDCRRCNAAETVAEAPAMSVGPNGRRELRQRWICSRPICRHAWSVPAKSITLTEAQALLEVGKPALLFV